VTASTRIIYINNPNNPTGGLLDLGTVDAVIEEAARRNIAVLMDEAYGDYFDESASSISLIGRYPNLIVTRTFSKGYGLARARVGYAVVSDELSKWYDEVDLPFAIPTFSADVALVALQDRDYIVACREKVRRQKRLLVDYLKTKGYRIAETADQCPIFLVGSRDENEDLAATFLRKGIHAAPGTSFDGLSNAWVRVNTPASSQEFISRLEYSICPVSNDCLVLDRNS
jgi:histidinol-phosphate aminotransferase